MSITLLLSKNPLRFCMIGNGLGLERLIPPGGRLMGVSGWWLGAWLVVKAIRKVRKDGNESKTTVGGRNPAPVNVVSIPLFTRFYTSNRWLGMGFLNHQEHGICHEPWYFCIHCLVSHDGFGHNFKNGPSSLTALAWVTTSVTRYL